jgi:hypothetical protein
MWRQVHYPEADEFYAIHALVSSSARMCLARDRRKMQLSPAAGTVCCAGTEIAGSFLTGSPLQPQSPSTFFTPAIGHRPVIMTQLPDGTTALSPHGDTAGEATLGNCAAQPGAILLLLACKPCWQGSPHHASPSVLFIISCLPALAPAALTGELAIAVPALGTSQALLNCDHAGIYYQGMPQLQEDDGSVSSSSGSRGFPLRRHGDAFERLPGGAYRALGRVDDTMNLGGIKVSSGESVAVRMLVLMLVLTCCGRTPGLATPHGENFAALLCVPACHPSSS